MNKTIAFGIFFILSILISCKQDTGITPRPIGYYRLNLPAKAYKKFDAYNCPFSLNISKYSVIIKNEKEYCWLDIYYPSLKAMIYITYRNVDDNLKQLIEDSREFVYKHTVKADAIQEVRFENKDLNVYGMLYDLKGNTASSVQFFLTDSTNHFIRGALYFNVRPNKDSLAPVIDYIRDDIVYLIESFEWK